MFKHVFSPVRAIVAATLSLLVICSSALTASATPSERGFQIPIGSITEENLDTLVNTWKVNILRVQIGNDVEMDGTTGTEYQAMMEEIFTALDQKLTLIQSRGLKMIFCLYSPPGGFLTREAPSHYRMFSDASLQDEFIQMWRTIMARYGSHPAIAGFDLVNEPASRKELLSPNVLTWNQLLLKTIAAIRETHPTKTLIVKSLYGDPSRLAGLPVIKDPNVIYSYNSYFFLAYQHTIIESAPFSIQRPSNEEILKKTRSRLAPFFAKIYNRVQSKALPISAYPPKIIVGEAAISACALESESFMQGLLTSLESDNLTQGIANRNKVLRKWRRNRRKNRSLPKPVFKAKDFLLDVRHEGYAIHAYGEYPLWDPRYVCAANGALSLAPEETGRSSVIKSFFSRNR